MNKQIQKILMGLFLIVFTASCVLAISSNEANKQNKPMVVMFHMQGCSACKKLAPIFDKMASKYSNKFKFVKEDVNQSTLSSKFNITSVPVVYIIEPKTQASHKIPSDCLWDQGCFEKQLIGYGK